MSPMQSILSKFEQSHDGARVARIASSVEAHNLELMLKENSISYHTRIHKHKKRGREFVITLLEVA